MNELLAGLLTGYMLVGIFMLVGSGVLEAFTEGWIDVLHGKAGGWLPVTTVVLYLLAVVQVTALWIFWPFVLWIRSQAPRRIERRRTP